MGAVWQYVARLYIHLGIWAGQGITGVHWEGVCIPYILCRCSKTDLLVDRDNYIRTLGATFGTYIHRGQAKISTVVNYEKQVNTPPDPRGAVVLSKFSR